MARDMYGFGIGLNYRGSGTYQTKVGALCTLVTYVMMIFNLVGLLTAFFDGSNQQEKIQTTTYDLHGTDKVNLAENEFEFILQIVPAIPLEIGRISVKQLKIAIPYYKETELELQTCSE